MQLNVTTDYGIRVVIYLAQKNSIANSNEICAKMGIPWSYMHKIARTLKSAGIINEVRGTMGGFELKKDPEKISVLNIINVFEKTTNVNRCMEKDEHCSRDAVSSCPVRNIYVQLQEEMDNILDVKISTFLKN
ncbi:MAG: Rrf2 family transcriptional regulator [Candidatus Bathyarchaeota archaeon]|uniref:RrF2 family transcriptional regulator n=1 Tax=Candidatus Bathycorpusculum sp. TaxID=2994959 RepID=UPI002827E080|nr:Rrf2 family transcriptional regulator [Candidatus Termiticorpusculum sp.]MCL2256736.1 Rrf2 family transcriptional regulator [Candidatus Termiticorpusculum sp.]MCL2291559.1 Rrf2 family transcriptional regulator [Candidatus Termiticorpusculum sp.]